MRPRSIFLAIVVAVLAQLTVAQQRPAFITVEGATLAARLEAAQRQGRTQSKPFWTGYTFDVRSGFSIDAEFNAGDAAARIASRNVGIFFLFEPGETTVSRVEIYNLDKQREYSGYPVYWMGRGANEESLALLQKNLRENGSAKRVSESLVTAIAVHDTPEVIPVLENLIRTETAEKIRKSAVFWLGQIPGGNSDLLASLARNPQESVEIRKQAVFAIGAGKQPNALATLESLFTEVTDRAVKRQILFAATLTPETERATAFLLAAVSNQSDVEVRKQAVFWLGQRAGKRVAEQLGAIAEKADNQTEIQNQAVFAISQRPKEEKLPLLMKIAQTHPKIEVRKKAMFWLGQIDDPRVVEFFRETLLK